MANLAHAELMGTVAANGTYAHAAGTGDAVVAVPAGAYLLSVSCWTLGAGATCQIGARDTVTLPTGGTLEQDCGGGILGAVNVTFAGGMGGYLVEWITMP